MNVIIVVVCVNIALVNAEVRIDIDTIKKLLQDNRYNNTYKEANEPVEAIQIIPGFYLEKPKSISKSLFRYPKLTQNDAYKTFNKIHTKHDGEKAQKSYTDTKYEDLLTKVLKTVKTFKKLQANKNNRDNIAQRHKPKTGFKTGDKLLVNKLLANIVNEVSNRNDIGERDLYKKKAKSKSMIESNTADQLRFQKLIAKALNTIKKDNTVVDEDSDSDLMKTSKYGTTLNNLWSSETNAGNVPLQILKEVQSNNQFKEKEKHPRSSLIVLAKPILLPIGHQASSLEDSFDEIPNSQAEEFENNASEIRDDGTEDEWGDSNNYGYQRDLRRKGNCTDEDSDYSLGSTIESSDESQEKNPGNPFTIHKNKYKQNWLWNHYMDGDHMNINPLGPQFSNAGPSGAELFFGRKWWYFNQDDYKPMG